MNNPEIHTPVIQITLGPICVADVDAAYEPLLRDVLRFEEIEFTSENGRLTSHWARKKAYLVSRDSRLVFPTGCVQRVSTALHQDGHRCQIQDHRGLDPETLRVDRTDVDQAERACRGITTCLERHTKGLEPLQESAQVRLVVDSEYVEKGITERLTKWQQRGWRAGRRSRLKPLENRDLWQQLDAQLQRHEVTCQWVRGHAGHQENEFVDQLAGEAAQFTLENEGGDLAQAAPTD